ncbi:uncharacterized protein PAC_03610 [Phialocephala subalpina]|uniref:Uncharacterized protein n=1 Tax=Phialocephala subalpina TaxID=576137 RepID=A0A1L7WLU9_9HELO|nr:uncharacterized protein PAC_03610 [Phialocephala subalpina]
MEMHAPPRVIKFSYKTDRNGNVGIRGNVPPIPLRISKKWKAEFSKRYVKTFATSHVSAMTWADHNRDTIYFDESHNEEDENNITGSVFDFISIINSAELRLVQSLAVHTAALVWAYEPFTVEILAQFGKLKTLHIIHDDKPDHIIEAGMTEKERNEELTTVEVWDLDEKVHGMEKWLASVHNSTIPPSQVHQPAFNQWVYHKSYKSEFKRVRKEMIAEKNVEEFPAPSTNRRS